MNTAPTTVTARSVGSGVLRLGVFGGAFDPPHVAHRALAQAARDQLQLDLLLVIPTGFGMHKQRAHATATQRLAMAELAFSGLDRVRVDPCEILRNGPSYTADTLDELRHRYPQAEVILVIGADQARAFQRWHRWQDIVRNAIICIARRDDSARDLVDFDSCFGGAARLHEIQFEPNPISASAIRELAHHGLSYKGLVPEAVARYIEHHHLYQTL